MYNSVSSWTQEVIDMFNGEFSTRRAAKESLQFGLAHVHDVIYSSCVRTRDRALFFRSNIRLSNITVVPKGLAACAFVDVDPFFDFIESTACKVARVSRFCQDERGWGYGRHTLHG